MTDIKLELHNYKLFAYEEKLAVREVYSLLDPEATKVEGKTFFAYRCKHPENAHRLVFFKSFEIDGILKFTDQFLREKTDDSRKQKRQNTRYYSHGIHEYKGKFNPQIVKALLNIFKINEGSRVLDPFCGSGTSLLESQLASCLPFGVDINPMATFIATTKTEILNDIDNFKNFDVKTFLKSVDKINIDLSVCNDRLSYLKQWFEEKYLVQIEAIRIAAEDKLHGAVKKLVLLTMSNILRDYSEQEPSDLRIRRRKTPYPDESLRVRFIHEFETISSKIIKISEDAVHVFPKATIINDSIINLLNKGDYNDFFDFAITSPPYATALPYIDTQRLSLVWLNLIRPAEIIPLECSLIGSREMKQKSAIEKLKNEFIHNESHISDESFNFCMSLYQKLLPTDGFRKQNVPMLLYKYFTEMKQMFVALYQLLKPGAFYCLVVGHNKTQIGGSTLIDTPMLLSKEAILCGFELKEITKLETYQRYGLHVQNAISTESLIVLQKPL